MSDDRDKYTKVEREILELLDEIEVQEEKPSPSNIVKFRRPDRRRVPRFSLPDMSEIRYALSPGKLLIIILVAILGAVLLQDVPFASPLLILVAAVAFVAVFFARSRPSAGGIASSKDSGIKRWRGRDIDFTRRG